MIERQRQDQCPKHDYFDHNGRFHMQIIPQAGRLSSQKNSGRGQFDNAIL
jgi:hypothetical protein